MQEATSTNQGIDEDGIEAAFDVSFFLCRVIIVIVVILVTVCEVHILCSCAAVMVVMCADVCYVIVVMCLL